MSWGELLGGMSGIQNGWLGLAGGLLQNQSSSKQASRAMQFSADMSNTAHQREVADLRAAGLNPILSGTGGMGASTPQGLAAPQVNVIQPAIDAMLSTAKTFSDIVRNSFESSKVAAQTETEVKFSRDNISANTGKSLADQGLVRSQTALNDFQRQINDELWQNPDMPQIIRHNYVLENAIKRFDKEIAEREANRMKFYESVDKEDYGKLLMILERVFGGVFKKR